MTEQPGRIAYLEEIIRHQHTEIERLRRWQEEAIQVDDEWQKVWEAAGRPGRPGQSKALAVAEWIKGQRT